MDLITLKKRGIKSGLTSDQIARALELNLAEARFEVDGCKISGPSAAIVSQRLLLSRLAREKFGHYIDDSNVDLLIFQKDFEKLKKIKETSFLVVANVTDRSFNSYKIINLRVDQGLLTLFFEP